MSDEETVVERKGKKAPKEKVELSKFSGDKQKAAAAAIALIKKNHGDDAVNLFGDCTLKDVEILSTGSMGLDIALGVGGYPRGRIIEIFGPEASGKTTLTLHAIANAQKKGGLAAFVDVEHALDPAYARALGVDMDALTFAQPSSGEEALSIVETLAQSGAYDVIVVDSVAALVPLAEQEAEMGAASMGVQARLMSQACRKLTPIVSESKTIVIFINQIRMKIGVMFGNPETTSGGNALKFYASGRLDIRKVGTLKQGEDVTGTRTRVKIIKNKVAPPFREVEFDILYGKGVSYLGELLDIGTQLELVEKSGAWYSYQGERIGQGRDKAMEYLSKSPDMIASLSAAIRKHYDLKD